LQDYGEPDSFGRLHCRRGVVEVKCDATELGLVSAWDRGLYDHGQAKLLCSRHDLRRALGHSLRDELSCGNGVHVLVEVRVRLPSVWPLLLIYSGVARRTTVPG